MTEHSTLDSYIIRVYRVNTDDCTKITGLAEAMDGSGERESFADMNELGAILNRRIGRPLKKGRKKRG